MTVQRPELFTIPIKFRPPKAWSQLLNATLFFIVLISGCLMINISQFIFLVPLLCIPFQSAKSLYAEGIRYTKGSFGNLLSEYKLCETIHAFRLAANHAPPV